jgi:hypothetical protein
MKNSCILLVVIYNYNNEYLIQELYKVMTVLNCIPQKITKILHNLSVDIRYLTSWNKLRI